MIEMYRDDLESPKNNYFGLIITSLKWCGVVIEEIENPREALFFKIYSAFVSITCIYYYIVAQTIDFALHLDDFEYVSFSLCYMVTQTSGLLKGTLLLINRKSISEYFKKLETGLFAPNIARGGPSENKFINRAVKYSNFQALVFYFFVVVIVGNRALSAAFEEQMEESFDYLTNRSVNKIVKVLPYNIYLPFDTQEHYNWAFFYQVFSCTLFGFYIGACDALITGIMIHVKAQILILKNSLFHIKDRAYMLYQKSNDTNIIIPNLDNPLEKVPQEIQTYVTLIVRDVIKHHQEIITLVEETEEKFNLVMLSQFLVSLLLMCLQLFQISLYDVNSPKFFSMVTYLMLMLFQLLIYCWNGNELSLESVDVARAVYNCDWMQFDNDSQKALMLMMLRAQKAFRLSAGKFAFLSLETYTTILRGSGSYYLALRKANE